MKRVIVAGANGFVGNAVVKELQRSGVEVLALVHSGSQNTLPDSVQTIEFELSEIGLLREHFLKHFLADGKDTVYDAFYNFAWQGSAGVQRSDPYLQINNIRWSVDLLRFAAEIGCKRVIGAGSIMEFETLSEGRRQGNALGGAYTYGAAKLASHLIGKAAAKECGIDFIWTYITNIYGPGELSPRFLSSTLSKIIDDEPLTFTEGTQNYNFIFIDDAARAFRLIGEKGLPLHEYLVSGKETGPLRDFILEMKSLFAPEKDFRFGAVSFQGASLPAEVFDNRQTRQDTAFVPEVSFRNGILRTMDWLREERGTALGD